MILFSLINIIWLIIQLIFFYFFELSISSNTFYCFPGIFFCLKIESNSFPFKYTFIVMKIYGETEDYSVNLVSLKNILKSWVKIIFAECDETLSFMNVHVSLSLLSFIMSYTKHLVHELRIIICLYHEPLSNLKR